MRDDNDMGEQTTNGDDLQAKTNALKAKANKLIEEARDKALHAWGTAQVFDRRADKLKRDLNLLTFVGIAAPLAVGIIVSLYGTKLKGLDVLIWIAAGVSVVQILVFLWSVVFQWQDRYEAASQSRKSNTSLSEQYEDLAQEDPADDAAVESLRQRKAPVDTLDSVQRTQDGEKGITEEELRYGMHAGLYKFQRKCSLCLEVPTNMEPNKEKKCGRCGDYPRRWAK
jgi:mobilome CxxCx(11)CxxC protein